MWAVNGIQKALGILNRINKMQCVFLRDLGLLGLNLFMRAFFQCVFFYDANSSQSICIVLEILT